jgi:hypothetical protein
MATGTSFGLDASAAGLVGLAELAELFGLAKSTVSERTRRPDFPRPLAVLAAGPVWRREDVVRYARQRSERFVERPGVQQLAQRRLAGEPAAGGSSPAGAVASCLTVAEAAETLGVEPARLREAAQAWPGMPARWHARTGRLVGIPADGLGVYARLFAAEPLEIAAVHRG